MATKTKRKSRNRRILICAVAAFLLLVSVLAYNSWLHQSPSKVALPQSSDYFAISGLAAACYTVGTNPAYNKTYYGPMVLIYDVAFYFTPVGGPARDVRIFAAGDYDPEGAADWEGIVIPNGTTTFSTEIVPPYPIPSTLQSNGTYTMQIRIAAAQADGYITLNFKAGVNLGSLGSQPV